MPQTHDLGGQPAEGPVNRGEHASSVWEKRTDALLGLLRRKEIIRTDELRRGIEGLGPQDYAQLTYYERWITSIEQLLVEKGVLTREEIDRKVREQEASGTW